MDGLSKYEAAVGLIVGCHTRARGRSATSSQIVIKQLTLNGLHCCDSLLPSKAHLDVSLPQVEVHQVVCAPQEAAITVVVLAEAARERVSVGYRPEGTGCRCP